MSRKRLYNLPTGVTLRKDGVYQKVYYDAFNRKRYVYANDLAELERKYKINTRVIEGVDLSAISTVEDLFLSYLNAKKLNTIKPQTIAIWVRNYDLHIREFLGSRRVIDVSVSTLDNMLLLWDKQNLSYKLQCRLFFYLKSIFHYAMAIGLRSSDPTALVTIVPPAVEIEDLKKNDDDNDNLEAHKYLDSKARAELLAMVHGHFLEPIVLIALYTGMRGGEICALRWSNIDLDNRKITVEATISDYFYETDNCYVPLYSTPKSYRSARIIPIHPALMDIFPRIGKHKNTVLVGSRLNTLHYCEYDDFLFASTKSNRVLSVKDLDAALRTKYYAKFRMDFRRYTLFGGEKPKRVRYTMHDLRATAATLMFQKELDLKEVQAILGHASIKTTFKYYIKATESGKRKSIEQIEI